MRMSRRMVRTLKAALLGETLLHILGESEQSHMLDRQAAAQKRYQERKRLEKLVRTGYILLGGEWVYLTEKGKLLLKQIQHQELKIPKRTWNGTWYLVTYDIPDSEKKARDAFRRQLVAWNFQKIQESIWVLPYDCKEEVALIAQDYRVAPYVLYMQATDLPMASKLRRYYNI